MIGTRTHTTKKESAIGWGYALVAVIYCVLFLRERDKRVPSLSNPAPRPSSFITHRFHADDLGSTVCECGDHFTATVHYGMPIREGDYDS